ncbi:ABC transporter permease, partial [Actinosynnema sp. NPDC023658]
FQAFTGAFVVSGGRGGPSDSTLLYPLYLYQRGFTDFRMGYASAMAWVLLVVVAVLTALVFRSARRWVFYAGENR